MGTRRVADLRGGATLGATTGPRVEANSEELNLERTTPVGIFPDGTSAEGVLDLAGNVWEWCSDWYDEKAYNRRAGRGDV